jgi:leader peptidase (prepilin peptidase)/N-methyltransferase
MSLETLLVVIAFVFGCVWGSFFNVAIYRLPREMSVIKPASHCFACNAPIAWYDNIPLVSWLVLRGRCRHCGAPFSFRYFVVELLSGLLFMFVMMRYVEAVTAKSSVVPGVIAILLHWCFVGGFIVLTFIDLDHKIIPDGVSLPGIVLGLLASFAVPTLVARFPLNGPDVSHWRGLLQGAIGAAVGGGLMLFIAVAGKAIFKKEAMGGGDIKLMAMIGAYMGWQLTLLVLFFSALVGTLVGVSLIAARRAAWSTQITFGPYIVLGALIAFFFGPGLIQWYFSLFHSPEMIPPLHGALSLLL